MSIKTMALSLAQSLQMTLSSPAAAHTSTSRSRPATSKLTAAVNVESNQPAPGESSQEASEVLFSSTKTSCPRTQP